MPEERCGQTESGDAAREDTMSSEELLEAIQADPDAAAKQAAEAIAEANARAAKEAEEKAAILRNKEDILGQLKRRKELGGEDDIMKWKAAFDEMEARRQADPDADQDANGDDEPEALKLERRRWESEKDLIRRRHEDDMAKLAQKLAETEKAESDLRADLHRREVQELIRAAAKGKVIDEAVDYLTDKLLPVFRRESDGSLLLHNPKTDLPMRSSTGAGSKSIEELVEEAMESKGSDPWNQGLAFCFKPMEGGAGGNSQGRTRITSDYLKMSKADKLEFIKKNGPEKFGGLVTKSTTQQALEASKAAAERRAQLSGRAGAGT